MKCDVVIGSQCGIGTDADGFVFANFSTWIKAPATLTTVHGGGELNVGSVAFTCILCGRTPASGLLTAPVVFRTTTTHLEENMNTFRVGDDVTVLNDCLEVPGLGFLPVNAYIVHAREPVVVDSGLGLPDRDFLATLREILDSATVRWIWLSHPDRDHTGGLFDLLEAAPEARLVTTFVAAGIMSCEQPLPLNRLHLLNPGQSLEVGDRTLHAFRPALFDNPATVGFYDDKSRICFSSDCFGGPLVSAELASGQDVREVPADQLRAAQLLRAAVDSPWVRNVDTARFMDTVRAMPVADAAAVLCTHLPPAIDINAQLLATLAEAPTSDPFVGPDQAALEAMLASFQPVTPAS